jgi:hypothetical protein
MSINIWQSVNSWGSLPPTQSSPDDFSGNILLGIGCSVVMI